MIVGARHGREPKTLAAAKDRRRSEDNGAPLIGFDVEGASVWVCRGADIGMVTAIIRALKGAK